MLHTFLVSLALLLPSDRKEPDLVVLEGGKEVECRVLYEDDQEVVYRSKRKQHSVPASEVKEIQTLERSLRELLARHEKADLADVKALAELAHFAEQHFLPGEARNLWIRVIAHDPLNEEAWTKLGGSKGRKGWRLQVRGRYYDLEELRTRAADWKNALELSTAHFLLRTDADPLRALDAAIDLERAYLAFYDLIGRPLKLHVFDEEPEIHVYSDPKDALAPPAPGMKVWFSPAINTLSILYAENPTAGEIVSEFTELLVFNAFRRSADTKVAALDPWLRQGLMSAFAAAVRPEPGRVRFEMEPPYRAWFQAVAADAKPLGLARVLTAGRGSFETGSEAERHAQSAYTLFHFLAFHENGTYRPALAGYVRDAFLGKGGKSRFLEALGKKEAELEAEWMAYVRRVAGT